MSDHFRHTRAPVHHGLERALNLSPCIGVLVMILFISISPSISAQKKNTSDHKRIQYPELAKELIMMRDTDQKLRIEWGGMIRKGKTESKRFKALSQKLLKADRDNTQRMKAIVAEYGWPTFDKVGEKGARSAWILVQHADRDPFFQAECLALMKEPLAENQVLPKNYAYLFDRVQVAFGEKQLYATQSTSNNGLWEGHFQPIANESKVQVRREAMGILRQVEEYASSMGFSYSIPTEEEAEYRADSLTQAYLRHQALGMEAVEKEDWERAVVHLQLATQCNGSVQAEDYVHLARALSLTQAPGAKRAFYLLIKATVRGFEGIDTFETDPDFMYLRAVSTDGWEDLMRLVSIAKQRNGTDE